MGKIYGKINDSDDTIAQTTINSIGTLLLTDIPSLMIGTDSTNGEFDIGVIALGDDEGDTGVNQSTATAQGTVTMANVKAEVQSIVRVGVIDISSSLEGGITVPSSATTSNAFGTLTLQSLSLDSPSVEVGMVAANHEGTANGSLELNPSHLKADQLIVSEGDRVILNVNGPTQASPGNLGSDGLYAAIDADNVMLAGEVVIRVNYQPAPGDSETINLLNADNITIDPSASVLIEGLASGIRLTNPSVVAADSGSRYQAVLSAADPRPVPALGLWQLAVLALLIAGLGGGLQRRR